jgi:hypothetical protein
LMGIAGHAAVVLKVEGRAKQAVHDSCTTARA